MGKRSALTLGLGLIVAVVGAVTAVVALRGGSSSPAGQVPALVAAKPIPAGTTGATAVSQGAVTTRPVASRPVGALTDASQLAGKTAAVAIPAGRVLTADLFPQSQTRIGTLRIPPDKTALALQMANVPGVAGFAGAGDRVDIFGLTKQGGAGGAPAARLILQGVEVLNVNGAVLAPTPGQPGGAGLVFLIAVSPVEAERLVYLTTFEQLYFALVPKERGPVVPTPGSSAGDSLKLP